MPDYDLRGHVPTSSVSLSLGLLCHSADLPPRILVHAGGQPGPSFGWKKGNEAFTIQWQILPPSFWSRTLSCILEEHLLQKNTKSGLRIDFVTQLATRPCKGIRHWFSPLLSQREKRARPNPKNYRNSVDDRSRIAERAIGTCTEVPC